MIMDTWIDQFEEECQDRALVGPAEVEKFLGALPANVASDPDLAFELSKIALELSWMRWPDRLGSFAEKLSPDDIFLKFQGLPKASDFFHLIQYNSTSPRNDALAESEFRLRSTYGDSMPEEHYVATYATTICTTSFRNPKRVISDFRSPTLDTTLHGFCAFGRQRSADPDDLHIEKRPDGRRIIIAPRRENRVSRNQMTLQLLSPEFAILQNTSATNKLVIAPHEMLGLGEKKLIRFPFVIILPHQRFSFQ